MSTNYHTPIANGASADSDTINDPLAELDQALSDVIVTEKDGHIIQEEGSDLAQQQRLNFAGSSVLAENDAGNSATKVTVDGSNLAVNVETLSGNKTLVDADAAIQVLDPGGADRDVTLPALASTNHNFTIINADSNYTITVKKPDTSTLESVADDNARNYYSDKSADWYAGGGGSVADTSTRFYTFDVSLSSTDLVVALKTLDGSDPSASVPVKIVVDDTDLEISSALSVTIPASAGDVFDFAAGGIQDHDCQLFVYIINNNGTPQLGLSPDPTLQTVASVYYDAGGQTGTPTQSNIVMSGTRNATNACVVAGRINAQQDSSNDWVSPDTSKVVNRQVFDTDWLTTTPTYSGFSTDPAGDLLYKIQRDMMTVKTEATGTGTSNAADFDIHLPFTTRNISSGIQPILVFDSGAYLDPNGWGFVASNSRVLAIYKATFGTDNFTASGGKKAFGTFSLPVFS